MFGASQAPALRPLAHAPPRRPFATTTLYQCMTLLAALA